MQITRRMLLATAAPAAAFAVAGCATDPTTGLPTGQLSPSVIDFIQNAVAAAAKYIPTVESIVEQAAALFGPGYSAIITAGSTALNSVIATLSSIVTSLTPAASSKFRARLRATSPSAPMVVGTTPQGVTVTGFRV